jgi:hypothetical protein
MPETATSCEMAGTRAEVSARTEMPTRAEVPTWTKVSTWTEVPARTKVSTTEVSTRAVPIVSDGIGSDRYAAKRENCRQGEGRRRCTQHVMSPHLIWNLLGKCRRSDRVPPALLIELLTNPLVGRFFYTKAPVPGLGRAAPTRLELFTAIVLQLTRWTAPRLSPILRQ